MNLKPLTHAAFRLWKDRVPHHVRNGLQRIVSRDRPGRALEVLADDTFIVSYPKSGNTWVRFLIANLLEPTPVDFARMEARVPTIYNTTTRELAEMPRPRVLKSHEYFDPRYRRVIYVVRDPRDVLVSYFHYSIRKGFAVESISEFGERFLAGRVNTFGTWHENVASWLGVRDGSPDFLLVRYEDLRRDCAGQLAEIAKLLGLSPTREQLAAVVAASAFDKMRELEQAADGQTKHLKRKRGDVPFVRSGRSGGWREELPPTLVEKLARDWAPMMRRLGYD